jgi:hypothetical protein
VRRDEAPLGAAQDGAGEVKRGGGERRTWNHERGCKRMPGELLVDAPLELGGHRRGDRGDAGCEAIARTRVGGDVRGRDEQPALALEDRRMQLWVGSGGACQSQRGDRLLRRTPLRGDRGLHRQQHRL